MQVTEVRIKLMEEPGERLQAFCSITFDDCTRDLLELSRDDLRKVRGAEMGMVFQSAALFDFLTVEENVLFGIRRWTKLGHREQRKLVADTLTLTGPATANPGLKVPALIAGMVAGADDSIG